MIFAKSLDSDIDVIAHRFQYFFFYLTGMFMTQKEFNPRTLSYPYICTKKKSIKKFDCHFNFYILVT